MKTRVHVNLSVSDVERSVQFYSLLFGEQPTKVRDDYANFRLDEPGLHLALVKSPARAAGDSSARHFGVELFENPELDDWRGRLEKAGVPLKIEEQVTCCYAVGNKFWARDPDGNDWEFWVRSGEAEVMHGDAAEACCAPEAAAVAVEASKVKDDAAPGTAKTAGESDCC